jgi:uncharacterized protein YxeA
MKKSYAIILAVVVVLAIGGTATALYVQKQNSDHEAMVMKQNEDAAMKKAEDDKAMKAAEAAKMKASEDAAMKNENAMSPSPSPSDAMVKDQ